MGNAAPLQSPPVILAAAGGEACEGVVRQFVHKWWHDLAAAAMHRQRRVEQKDLVHSGAVASRQQHLQHPHNLTPPGGRVGGGSPVPSAAGAALQAGRREGGRVGRDVTVEGQQAACPGDDAQWGARQQLKQHAALQGKRCGRQRIGLTPSRCRACGEWGS
jgi:hypothetical protein